MTLCMKPSVQKGTNYSDEHRAEILYFGLAYHSYKS